MPDGARPVRGQAITLNYTIGLGIAVILITGLLVAGGSFIDRQQEEAVRTELRVIGQQIAADVSTADRLVQATDTQQTVTLYRTLPTQAGGTNYYVEIEAGPDPTLTLTSRDPDVEVEVALLNETTLGQSRVLGGPVRINRTASGNITIESGGRES